MTCPKITQSLWIKDNGMRIMLDTSLGIYFQDQTQLSIISWKGLRMFCTHTEKSCQDNSLTIILISTITW